MRRERSDGRFEGRWRWHDFTCDIVGQDRAEVSLKDVVPLTDETVVIFRSGLRIVSSSCSFFPRLVGTDEVKNVNVLSVSFVRGCIAIKIRRSIFGKTSNR